MFAVMKKKSSLKSAYAGEVKADIFRTKILAG